VVEKDGEAVYPFGDENQAALSAEHAAWGPLVLGALLDVAREHRLGGTTPIGGKKEKVEYRTSEYFGLTRPLSAESWVAYMKELYYFGWSPKRSQTLGRSVHSKIENILHLQEPFSSLHRLVDALNVTGLLSLDGKKHLKNNDISDYYIDRVLAGEVAVQYGNDLGHVNAVHAALAAYNADDGRGRHGGKMQDVLEAITTELVGGSTLRTETQIVGIRHLQHDDKWVLLSRSHLVDGGYQYEEAEMFDAVILAAPYVPGAIEFRNTTLWTEPEAIQYRSAHLMWHTQSEDLYDDVFGGEKKSNAKISDRLIANAENGFAELVKQETLVDEENGDGENLYRTLTPDLDAVSYSNASWSIELEIPHAYPDTRPRSALPPIELDEGFWHTGGIEAVGSSVGLSAWAGKNAARLAVEWLGILEGNLDTLLARSLRENGDPVVDDMIGWA